jgi:hypothetical protein
LPQPTLHGMDEGLTAKTNKGVLEAVIIEAKATLGYSATKVRPSPKHIVMIIDNVNYPVL